MPSSFNSQQQSGQMQQLFTPQKQLVTPRKLFASEQQPDEQRQKLVTPREMVTPRKLFVSRKQTDQQQFTPQKQPDQQRQLFTPQKQPDRQRKLFTPRKQPSQQQQMFTPQKQSDQQQQLFTPQQTQLYAAQQHQLYAAQQQQLYAAQQQQLYAAQQQQLYALQQQQLFAPQQQQLFAPKHSSPFQQTTSPFSQLTAQQQQNLQVQLFQQQQHLPLQQYQQQQQLPLQQFQEQQQQLEQPQLQLHLFNNDGDPATYSTKLADLHPDSQKLLLQIEERIMEHRGESQRLDRCNRLYDSSVSNYGFESDEILIVQELGRISTTMKYQKAVGQELIAVVKDMLLSTEAVVLSSLMIRPRFLHPKSSGAPNTSASIQASGGISVMGTGQSMTTATGPVFDFYSGLPRKPSQFLLQTVARFDKYLGEYHQLIEELEQLLLVDTDKNGINSSSSLLQALPKIMSNGHNFFVHVAAKVESIHQYIESRRTAYLADNRRQGLYNDPFLEADRRETAKEEVAAKRVHPTLHLLAISQPSTQVSGLTSTVPTNPHTTVSASSESKSSLFDTPSAGTSSSPLFSTPATAASSSLFGGFITPVQTSLGASAPTLSSASLFGSTPVAISSFSNPFNPGSTSNGSGSSRGKTSRKPRTKK